MTLPDGLLDGEELAWGTEPLNPDTDADTLPDGREVKELQTNPLSADTDLDGILDNEDPSPGVASTPTPSPTPTATVTETPTLEPATQTAPPATETATLEPPTPTPTSGSPAARLMIVISANPKPTTRMPAVMYFDEAGRLKLTTRRACNGDGSASGIWPFSIMAIRSR